MGYRRLFLFVEGDDDERFFRSLRPHFDALYEDVEFVKSSQMPKAKLGAFLRSVMSMKADYLVIRDRDSYPCTTAAKEAIRRGHPLVDPARIQIVQTEIESWYCAGLRDDDTELGSLEIATCGDTAEITKETFNADLNQLRAPRIPAMIAMLEHFDLATAAKRNASFRYFLRKHLDLDPS